MVKHERDIDVILRELYNIVISVVLLSWWFVLIYHEQKRMKFRRIFNRFLKKSRGYLSRLGTHPNLREDQKHYLDDFLLIEKLR